ncbi:MAG: hypothetical protein IPL75_09150 [Acidobacteria bacterium]|nr:hypothetical protein [Acidobacteriota bacterium]
MIDAGTGNPLQGIFVQIYDASGRSVGGSSTDASGNFVTGSGLSTGTYYARTTNSQGYLDELFNNKPCVGSCSVLAGDGFVVTVGATTPNINFSLTQGGRISGTITDATTSAPLTSVSVSVYDSTGRFVASGGTNSFGVYTTSQAWRQAPTTSARTTDWVISTSCSAAPRAWATAWSRPARRSR